MGCQVTDVFDPVCGVRLLGTWVTDGQLMGAHTVL